ncbi:MAG TPA: type I-MYXAN CRISPR-associated Cas8a1/Cmx1 [Gemmataceae bacterium]|jgi:CRISPR-associated protein Cas8a1/Csx13
MVDEQELTWRLSDPGMDLLERAGLAGLYMALRAATDAGVDLSPLTWHDEDLKPDAVTIRWSGPAKPTFVKLIKWAWQVRDGVLYFPAVHDAKDSAMIQNRVAMHNGIMRTFLQHTNVQPKGEPVMQNIQLDENREVSISYQPPIIRPPKAKGSDEAPKANVSKKLLKPWKDIDELFDRKGAFRNDLVRLSNWVYPGIAGRYGGESAWEGAPERALLLMLTPTVCFYLRLQGEGGNWVFVIPDVADLEELNATRRRMALNVDFVDVASLGDAGLRFLSEYATRNPRKTLGAGCRVVAMGKVSYYASQSIRKSVLDVAPDLLPVKRYRILHRELPNTYVSVKTQTPLNGAEVLKTKGRSKKRPKSTAQATDQPKPAGFIKLPAARGRIADNLVSSRPWYTDLVVPLVWNLDEAERERKKLGTSLERAWFQAICYQRSKLMKLIAEDDMWDTEAEKVFVEAFWETLDALYAQEAAATERGGSRTVTERFEDLNDEIRRRLTQAKTRTLLRTALADLFAKAGRQKSVRSHPAAVWRLIDHPDHWRKGRDLALLALASHRKKDDRASTTAQEKGA